MKQALSCVLLNYFTNSKSSLEFLANIIIALITVRDVNLTQINLPICADKLSSGYRALQRFFTKFEFNYTEVAKLLLNLAKLENMQWLLAMDRTNWKFGKKSINILMLSICHNGIAIPIMWLMLDKQGSSNYLERRKLILRFIRVFGNSSIEGLLMDREFIGDEWLHFLSDTSIKFYVRIKQNHTIGRSTGELTTANNLVRDLKNGTGIILPGLRKLGEAQKGPRVSISALRNDKGELVIIATNGDNEQAIMLYKRRWEIESLFGCFKTRGFNFENTHMTDLKKINKLIAILAITFTLAHMVGEWQNEINPIKFKTHKRKEKSIFRLGLDYLQQALFKNLTKLEEIILNFIRPLCHDTRVFHSC